MPAYRRTQYQRQTQAARERAKAYTKRYNRPAPAAIFNNIPIPMSPVDKLARVLLKLTNSSTCSRVLCKLTS